MGTASLAALGTGAGKASGPNPTLGTRDDWLDSTLLGRSADDWLNGAHDPNRPITS